MGPAMNSASNPQNRSRTPTQPLSYGQPNQPASYGAYDQTTSQNYLQRSTNPQGSAQPSDTRTMTRSPLNQNYNYQSRPSAPANHPGVSQSQGYAPQTPSTQASAPSAPTAPVTVDPNQVYDRTAELEREMLKAEAIRKAEEERRADQEREEEAKKRKEQQEAEDAKKMAEARKLSQKGAASNEAPKKKRNRKSNNTKAANGDAAANAAAMTLMKTANLGAGEGNPEDIESQMRAMFAKMRELNSKNPDLLSKMWQQERDSYFADEADKPKPAESQKGPADALASTKATKPKKKTTPKKIKPADHTTVSTQSHEGASKSQQPASNARQAVSNNHASPQNKTSAESIQSASKLSEKANGKTVWPEKRKAQLAQSASSLIGKMPENGGRTVPPDEIAGILDSNPSYLELCQQIEAKGFRLNKSQFAKALLSSVPGINRSKADELVGQASQTSAQLEGLDAIKQFNEHPQTVDTPVIPASSTVESITNKKKSKPPVPLAPALPPSKEDLARKRTFADLVDLTTLSDEDGAPSPKRLQTGNTEDASTSLEQDQPRQLPTPPQTDAASQAPVVPAMGGRKSSVPPSTTGQFGYLQNYPQPVLSQQPTSKPAHNVPRDHPIHNILVGEKIARSKVLRRSKYNPKTIARDVLLASGRHPDMRHLNAHLDILRSLKAKEDVDLSTVRWDVIDPGGALPGAGISTEPLPEDELDDTLFADDESSDDETLPGTTQDVATRSGAVAISTAATPGVRIRQYKPRKSDPTGVRQVATPNKPAPTGSASTSSYSALRAASGDVKKKGRPVGWRKWMQKDRQEGGSPAPPTGPKRKGRPPGSASKPPPKPPSPEFPSFKCEWEGCSAELHNLDTLRRHIFKIHGEKRAAGEWVCRWKGCSKTIGVADGPRTVPKIVKQTFEGGTQWRKHVEDEHLLQIQWKQGDGPAAGLTEGDGEVSDAVLSDREGRQVTPRISMPNSPAEALQRADQERNEGAQGPAPDVGRRRQTPLEEASGELYSAEERRRRLGVGIDKGGATLVNEKRRMGFVEDGDVEMVDDE
ncbi:MAG: hypothetical protein Q9159_001164 [Coniocarpon cinnabarinum]